MARTKLHIFPHASGDWIVKDEVSGREFGHYSSEGAAAAVGRALARKRGAELLIHDEAGRVRREARRGAWLRSLFGGR
jgi:hypothetical protein